MIKKVIHLFFVLSVSLTVFGQAVITDSIPYGNNIAVGKYYDIRGIKIYAEEYGKGEPLLMIHGNGGSINSMKKIIPFFSAKYKVIVADSRAQGKSVDNGDSLSFEMIADDEAALLNAMHIDSVYVIGASDGGIIALVLAMRHPEKVKKLAETGADLVPDSTAIAIVPASWEKEKKFSEENKNKVFASAEEKNHYKVKMMDWQQPNIPFSALRSIQCPSLVISGDHDMFTIDHAVQIYKNIPKAYLWILPNSGHGTLREHTDDFNKMVDEFFSTPYKQR